jgi:hypothetical protein
MQLQLEQLVERIDLAFGDELAFSAKAVSPDDREVLLRVFGDEGYQEYLQDQVNRQIIRDYLTNAVVLGFVTEQALEAFGAHLGSREARSSLSLHMLMSSVEQAGELLARGVPSKLELLKSEPGSPPHMRLIRN